MNGKDVISTGKPALERFILITVQIADRIIKYEFFRFQTTNNFV